MNVMNIKIWPQRHYIHKHTHTHNSGRGLRKQFPNAKKKIVNEPNVNNKRDEDV